MGSPSVGQIQVPTTLMTLTLQYKPKGLIGEQVAPIVPVPSPEMKILKYTKANLFRLQDQDLFRNEGAERKRFSFDIQTTSANPRQVGLEWAVTDELLDITSMPGQLPLQPQIDAVQHMCTRIDEWKEIQIANTIYGNIWVDGTTGGSAPSAGNGGWVLDTTANSIIQDVFNAKVAVWQQSNEIPNVFVIDYPTFIAQQTNPNMSDKIKYTQISITTASLMAEVFQIDELLVGRNLISKSNRNVLGTPPTFTSVWNPSGHGNGFLFLRNPPGLRTLSALFQFRLPYMGSLRLIRAYREERVSSVIYQITEQVDIAPVATDVGYAWARTAS